MAAGIAAEHVGNVGMSRATDADILRFAEMNQFVLVTLDARIFHHLLAASRATSTLRGADSNRGAQGGPTGGTSPGSDCRRRESARCRAAVVSVTERRVRMRMLPIGT